MKSNANFFSIPYVRFAIVLLFTVLLVFGTIYLACLENSFSLKIQPNMTIKSIYGEMALEKIDLAPEPGDLQNQVEYDRFMARQDELAKIIKAETITVIQNGNVTEYQAAKRNLTDLPLLFWIQVFVTFAGIFMSGWIWALKPKHLPSLFFFFSGLTMGLSAIASAVYTTRLIALPIHLFKPLSLINASSAPAFGIAMIGLFLIYPLELRRWKKLFISTFLFFSLSTLACIMQWWSLEIPDISFLIVLMIILLAVAIGWQFVASKSDPKSRAILLWLGISVLFGCGIFVVFNTVPVLLGLKPLEQGYAFLSFLIVYLGIAFGLKQFRLFEVGEWAYKFLFYTVGTLIMVAVDAGLIYSVGVSRLPALGMALILVSFCYLPLRDYFWRLFKQSKELQPEELLNEALHVTLAPSPAARLQRWEDLVRKLFNPLEINYCQTDETTVVLDNDGVALTFPAIADIPALRVAYPWSGRALFSLRAVEVAKQVVKFVEEAESSRQAYDRGVLEERLRIAQDLHDDVGARLLTGLYGENSDLRSTIQGAMADIRSIVKGIAGEKVLLCDLLADLRSESHIRLHAVGTELTWVLPERDNHEVTIDYHLYKALSSVIREIVSNTIKHANAKKIEIKVNIIDDTIHIVASDDGNGFPEKVLRGETGFGLKGMSKRITDLGGKFEIKNSPKAYISIITPLNAG